MKSLYLSVGKFLKIHILFFPLILASILGNYFTSFSVAYLSALIHEAGHIVAAYITGVKISHIEILPFGICGRLTNTIIKNPDNEIFIALCGPVISFALALSAYLLRTILPLSRDIIIINIALGAVNLIPALPLDGGRILRGQLTKKYGILPAARVCRFVSFVFTALMIALSLYGLLTCKFNFSLILVSSFLLGSLCSEQKMISVSVMSEMLRFEDKLGTDTFSKGCILVADEKTQARRILKKLSYDRYHIVLVCDEGLNIKKILTEGKILSALTEKGIRLRLEEIS